MAEIREPRTVEVSVCLEEGGVRVVAKVGQDEDLRRSVLLLFYDFTRSGQLPKLAWPTGTYTVTITPEGGLLRLSAPVSTSSPA